LDLTDFNGGKFFVAVDNYFDFKLVCDNLPLDKGYYNLCVLLGLNGDTVELTPNK